MFAYLISKLLCNIYQSLDVRSEKSASLERTKTSFGLKETYVPGKPFETAGQEKLSSLYLPWFELHSLHALKSFLEKYWTT